jgi:hypothetical protein
MRSPTFLQMPVPNGGHFELSCPDQVLDSFADVLPQRIFYNIMDQYGRCRLADISENQRSEISARVRDQCIALDLPYPSAPLQGYLIGQIHGIENGLMKRKLKRAETRLNK